MITKLQIAILKWIAQKIVVQGPCHTENIIIYYKILADASRKEFNENNRLTLDWFLIDCHKESLEKGKKI